MEAEQELAVCESQAEREPAVYELGGEQEPTVGLDGVSYPVREASFSQSSQSTEKDRLFRDFGMKSEKKEELIDDYKELRDSILIAIEEQDEIRLSDLIDEAR